MILHAPRLPHPVHQVQCPNGELLLAFRCMLHSTHVTVAGGEKGVATALCLEVNEVLELVDALNAGPSSPALQQTEGGFKQRSQLVKCGGIWGLSVSEAGGFYLTLGLPAAPTAIMPVTDAGRAHLVAALLELAAGKAAAA